MRFKSSIVAIAALSSMSFAGGDIGGVVDLGNKYDYVPAQPEYVAPVQEYVAPVQEYVAPAEEEYVAPVQEYVAPAEEEYVAPYVAPAPAPTYVAPAPAPAYVAPAPAYVAPAPTPYVAPPVTPTVPPVVVTPKPTPKPTPAYHKPEASGPLGVYVGGALTAMAARSDCAGNRANVFSEEKGQDRQIGFTGILGYDFMEYLGAELRTSMGLANDDGTKMEQYGLYLKPNYDLTKALNLYGLLGYSTTNMSDCGSRADLDNTNSGFSYGAGLDYGVTENISVFTDIVNYLRDDKTRSTWGTSVGVKYKF